MLQFGKHCLWVANFVGNVLVSPLYSYVQRYRITLNILVEFAVCYGIHKMGNDIKY